MIIVPYHRPDTEEYIAVERGPSDNSGHPGRGDSGPEIKVDTTSQQADDDKGVNPIGFSGGIGWLRGENFVKILNLDISFGFSDSRSTWSEVYIGAGWAGVDNNSELDDAIHDGVILLNLGFNYKRKIFENTNWDTPYFICGAAYRNMFWEYENTITTTDGEWIHRENLGGLELKAGLGRNLIKANGKNFGIEVFPSVIYWLPQTNKGFENDVFDPFLMLNVRGVFSSW